jgi:hypothetical protein
LDVGEYCGFADKQTWYKGQLQKCIIGEFVSLIALHAYSLQYGASVGTEIIESIHGLKMCTTDKAHQHQSCYTEWKNK